MSKEAYAPSGTILRPAEQRRTPRNVPRGLPGKQTESDLALSLNPRLSQANTVASRRVHRVAETQPIGDASSDALTSWGDVLASLQTSQSAYEIYLQTSAVLRRPPVHYVHEHPGHLFVIHFPAKDRFISNADFKDESRFQRCSP